MITHNRIIAYADKILHYACNVNQISGIRNLGAKSAG